ncbi:DUF2934 domain-containing protein [Paraburkholderia phenoliruptrix]|uniref:DUF2934 domain-containing protein n=1 Tax=Paraburkholderia phenoliruptrix TaxID=252970 RepID=UPI0001C02D9D|nr:DUF2934 domain-containing protein [Paraburkholderia phenoliruptrix]WMY06653.1 DUF2934 domain-containing protein [Paraburkholderia phenoliruptrix]
MDGLPHEPTVEDRIRKRAYELWESDGSPEGRADDYWARAEAQIEAEGESGDAEPAVASDQSGKGRRAAEAIGDDEAAQAAGNAPGGS